MHDKEYTMDPTHGEYKKLFSTNMKDPVSGKIRPKSTYITFAGIKFYY